ncbi:MAG: hypothetical protein KKC85_09915 [Gammaproteobacteria bacterium]|nr:hypothetical protein [Gammaproteobacteria bacterium]MBU1443378.1 hypothetical protein [Gammaproteobacteria bacterium]MBU2286737.1 hypothetical protein [Gammaproteobacteria bacterium]
MSAGRVLLAWEHGRNLGHLVRLAGTAQRFAGLTAAEPAWAVPAARLGHPLIERIGGPRHAVPVVGHGLVPGPIRSARAFSFADVLLALGHGHADALQSSVSRWLGLFDRLRARAVVCDYAPAAQLAACLAGLPALQITNGFDAPPPDFPLFDSGVRGPFVQRARASGIERLSEAVLQVWQRFGQPGLGLQTVMSWPRRVCDGIAETDPYGARADMTYIGPFAGDRGLAPAEWPDTAAGARRVLAYLRGDEQEIQALLDALCDAGATTCCVWPEATDRLLQKYAQSPVAVSRRAVDWSASLAAADAVVNYGSSSAACSALLAGKPQLMVPTDVEKTMIARRIASHGAGILRMPRAEGLAADVGALLADPRLAGAARGVASRYRAADFDAAKGVVAEWLHGAGVD